MFQLRDLFTWVNCEPPLLADSSAEPPRKLKILEWSSLSHLLQGIFQPRMNPVLTLQMDSFCELSGSLKVALKWHLLLPGEERSRRGCVVVTEKARRHYLIAMGWGTSAAAFTRACVNSWSQSGSTWQIMRSKNHLFLDHLPMQARGQGKRIKPLPWCRLAGDSAKVEGSLSPSKLFLEAYPIL